MQNYSNKISTLVFKLRQLKRHVTVLFILLLKILLILYLPISHKKRMQKLCTVTLNIKQEERENVASNKRALVASRFLILFSFTEQQKPSNAKRVSKQVCADGFIFGRHAYLSSGWNIMDGCLVVISLVDIIVSMSASHSPRIFAILRVFRLLRTLRPLRYQLVWLTYIQIYMFICVYYTQCLRSDDVAEGLAMRFLTITLLLYYDVTVNSFCRAAISTALI